MPCENERNQFTESTHSQMLFSGIEVQERAAGAAAAQALLLPLRTSHRTLGSMLLTRHSAWGNSDVLVVLQKGEKGVGGCLALASSSCSFSLHLLLLHWLCPPFLALPPHHPLIPPTHPRPHLQQLARAELRNGAHGPGQACPQQLEGQGDCTQARQGGGEWVSAL